MSGPGRNSVVPGSAERPSGTAREGRRDLERKSCDPLHNVSTRFAAGSRQFGEAGEPSAIRSSAAPVEDPGGGHHEAGEGLVHVLHAVRQHALRVAEHGRRVRRDRRRGPRARAGRRRGRRRAAASPVKCTYLPCSSRSTEIAHWSIVMPRIFSAHPPIGSRNSHSQNAASRHGAVASPRTSGEQRPTVALQRHREAEPLEHRRHHVDVLGEAIGRRRVPRACRRVGIAHDAGDVVALLEPAELLGEPVVAELLAVVGREHDERVVPHAATRAARRTAGRAARRPRSSSRSRWRASGGARRGRHRAARRGSRPRPPGPGAPRPRPRTWRARTGSGTVGRVVHRGVRLGRDERRVRPDVRRVHEPRLGRRRRRGRAPHRSGTRPRCARRRRPRARRARPTPARTSRARPPGRRSPACAATRPTPRGAPGGRRRRGIRAAHPRRRRGACRRARACAGRATRRCSRTAPGRSRRRALRARGS